MPAATLLDQGALAKDASFVSRVQAALVAEALAVISEATTTANHELRAKFASAVLSNAGGFAALMAPGVAVDSQVALDAGSPQTQATVTDADITRAVAGLWNAYAVGG